MENFQTGIKGFASVGSVVRHPLYGKIRILQWLGFAAGESLVVAERFKKNCPVCGLFLKKDGTCHRAWKDHEYGWCFTVPTLSQRIAGS